MAVEDLEAEAEFPQGAEDLRFHVLGSIAILAGRRRLKMGPPRQLAVLSLMIMNAGQVVSVRQLIQGLWGDAVPPEPTPTLQCYISRLRKSLSRGLPGRPQSTLRFRAPGYVLDADLGQIDAIRFERAAAEGQRLLGAGSLVAARERLTGALELWRGTPYAELGAYEFAANEATRLEQLRLTAVEARAEACFGLGLHDAVVDELAREVHSSPLRERLVGQLMLALYRSGRQAEALQAFERTRSELAEQLGIDVTKELQELRNAILRQEPHLELGVPAGCGAPVANGAAPAGDRIVAVPAPRIPAPAPPVDAPAWPNMARLAASAERLPFAGRVPETARLDRATAATFGDGCKQMLFVLGEPGIGKTRFLREAIRRLPRAEIDAVWGSCYQGPGAPPYWLWTQVLRHLAAVRPEGYRNAAAGFESALAAVLPEQVLPAQPEAPAEPPAPGAEPGENATARFRTHDAVCQTLTALARERPIALFLEDLHWADEPSLALLQVLATQSAAPLFVMATARSGDLDMTAGLRQTLGRVLRETSVQAVELAGLGPDEVEVLVRAAVGPRAGSGLARSLHERTGGNPYFLSQLLASLDGMDGAGPERVSELLLTSIPVGVREVLRHRFTALTERAYGGLQICAALGGGDLELGRVADLLGTEQAAETIEAAAHAGLLRVCPRAADRFRFTHELVRETLCEELRRTPRVLLPSWAAIRQGVAEHTGDYASPRL